MDDTIPDWLLLALGVLADIAVIYGGVRLVRRIVRRRGARSADGSSKDESGQRS